MAWNQLLSIVSLLFACGTAGLARLRNDDIRCDPKIRLVFIGCFGVLWMIAACLSTLIGPFDDTGNGYFAVWGAVVCTILAAMDIKQEIDRVYI